MIKMNTITSPNTTITLPAPIIKQIALIIEIASKMLSKIINRIILSTPSIIGAVNFANQISFLSKHVAHLYTDSYNEEYMPGFS